MLIIVPDTIVNETSKVRIIWKLCNQILKSIENVIFNTKLTFFVSLTNALRILVSCFKWVLQYHL